MLLPRPAVCPSPRSATSLPAFEESPCCPERYSLSTFSSTASATRPNIARSTTRPSQPCAPRSKGTGCVSTACPAPAKPKPRTPSFSPSSRRLGWAWLVQPPTDRRRRDVADALLFTDEAACARARPLPPIERIRHGAVIVENEARLTRLDRTSGNGEAPSSQLLRYLSRADTQSEGALRWGLLTNGGIWRLYYDRVASRAEGYVEINLAALLAPLPLAPVPTPPGAPADHWFRVFLLLFRPAAFVVEPGQPSFLLRILERTRDYRTRVTSNLAARVFSRVFPQLLAAFAANDPRADILSPEWRTEAREGAIRFLYRLLFVLSAEDRRLLPVDNPAYHPYSLDALRREAARIADDATVLPTAARGRWTRLADVFRAISDGDAALGLPAYNGGLFHDAPGDILSRVQLPDRVLIPLVDAMSRDGETGRDRPRINYRDLSVQHLGSIYERLLEHDAVPEGPPGAARLLLRPSPYARKNTGSFYTPQELVDLVLRQAVDPLVAEKHEAFRALLPPTPSPELPPNPETHAALRAADPACAILSLRICDFAMGSGHFLVSLGDRLTDAILLAMAEARALVPGGAYTSPLADEIAATRARIAANAPTPAPLDNAALDDATLDDKHIVRRMVLKRCVFGVDLNPMAVELAKLSLWLHSFTVGAPLSFLDHHLRCGDSLFGEFVGPALEQLGREFGLVGTPALAAARQAAGAFAAVETRPDLDLEEVDASRDEFALAEAATAPLRALLDIYHAMRWHPAATEADRIARGFLLNGQYGDLTRLLAGDPLSPPRDPAQRLAVVRRTVTTAADAFAAAGIIVSHARRLRENARFLHWQLAFPGIWPDLAATPQPGDPCPGGFHAVIGNPPWDRIKMQEVEWWAARDANVACLTRAADRKSAIRARRAVNDPLAADYDRAADRARRAAEVARALPKLHRSGEMRGPYALYPLFAKGDVNLYALFTERAGQLVAATGIVALLVPSGVAADKGAATFFRSISNTGRLGALLDFENRRPATGLDPFFPAVDSRFKFAALIHGGVARTYPVARCAFFQSDAEAAEAAAFSIAPADFTAVNPNTGTAPVFRSPADARRVLGIYRRLPVLRAGDAPPAYPVAYATQLHMTKDSHLFRSAEELEADGAYPMPDGRWQRGNARYLPLVVGRSIHLFDHRFASVMEDDAEEVEPPDDNEDDAPVPARTRRPTRTERVHNPYSSNQTEPEQHADPAYLPQPRYWVEQADLLDRWPLELEWALAFRDIARPTDVRTAISAIVARSAFGNTLPLLLPRYPKRPTGTGVNPEQILRWHAACHNVAGLYKSTAALLVGNINSIPFDYVARNKVQSAHLNSYVLEQLPVVPPEGFTRSFGPRTAEQIVRDDVLALTYTAHDLAPFARDQGFAGPPFCWDEEDRLRRRARLDAVFFLLFGLDRTEAAAVLDTFPIVRRTEEQRYGTFRTRDLVLRTMSALEANDPDAVVAG